jgi:hypothetical protein
VTRQGEEIIGSAERYRHNAGDDCRQRSQQARTAADKANWLKIAEEWQKLAEEVDVANGLQSGGSWREMTDDDPNEAYEVVPIEPGPHGPPKGWWTVKRNGLPVRHFPGKEKAERYATDPEYRVLSPGRLGRRRRGSDPEFKSVFNSELLWSGTDADIHRWGFGDGLATAALARHSLSIWIEDTSRTIALGPARWCSFEKPTLDSMFQIAVRRIGPLAKSSGR